MLISACSGESPDDKLLPSAVADSLSVSGLTCEVQDNISSFSADELDEFKGIVSSIYTPEEFGVIVSEMEDCQTSPPEHPSVHQAVGAYPMVVETIEVGTFYLYPTWTSVILDDGTAYGWMCGQDPGSPPDKIFQYNYITNAYIYSQNLRFRPDDAFGSCLNGAFLGKFGSRAYVDDSIRMCVGYTRYNACTYVGTPSLGSIKLKGNP